MDSRSSRSKRSVSEQVSSGIDLFIKVVIVACIALLFGFLVFQLIYPLIPRPRDPQTLARVKEIGRGVEIYRGGYDDRFPPDMSSARAAYRHIGFDNVKELLFESGIGEPREWLGNGSLASKNQSEIAKYDQSLMFFDSQPMPGSERPWRIISFANTACRVVSEKWFQAGVADSWVMPKGEPR